MIPVNNMVLLRPINESMMRKLPGTDLILGVPSHTKDQYLKNYAQRHFLVVDHPKDLIIPKNKKMLTTQKAAITWSTKVEIQKGDIVWVMLKAGQSAHQIKIEGVWHYLVHYANLFVAQRRCFHVDWDKKDPNILKRDDVMWKVIPLNGYLICETMYDKPKSDLILMPDLRPTKKVTLKVKFVGSPVDYYVGLDERGRFKITRASEGEYAPGMIIYPRVSTMPDSRFYINIEGDYFKDFDGKNSLVAIERRFVIGRC